MILRKDDTTVQKPWAVLDFLKLKSKSFKVSNFVSQKGFSEYDLKRGLIMKFSFQTRNAIVLIIMLSVVAGCGVKTTDTPPGSIDLVSATQLTFSGAGVNGIFDPSLDFDVGSNRLWMSYSALNPSLTWPSQNVRAISTRVAYSDDHGLTFTDSGLVLNRIDDVTLPLAAPNNAGTWLQEVSSIAFDATASSGERWRLFSHHYLMINGIPRQEHSWISFKKASSVSALSSSPEMKLFTGTAYDTSNNTAGGSSRSPLGGAPVITLSSLFGSLAACAIFTEPGAMVTSSALYLSLSCKEVPGGITQNRVILLKCAQPCDPLQASNWSLVGTIFSHSSAVSAGFKDYDGASLFAKDGSFFMSVSPTSDNPVTDAYNGCLIYRFTNIDLGQIESIPTARISGSTNSFNGACGAHAQATASGVLYSEINLSGSVVQGKVYQSHQN